MQQTAHQGMESVQGKVVQQLTEGRQQTGADFKALRESNERLGEAERAADVA